MPSESTFSRAFATFAEGELASHLHAALIEQTHADRLVGHIARDSTAIEARETRPKAPQPRAVSPKRCDVGAKHNAKGHLVSCIGDKLHIDTADGDIPISCILTSASVNDSQVAIPLATMTKAHVANLYDIMDSAYDVTDIRDHSRSLGHVPIIDSHPRTAPRKQEMADEERRRKRLRFRLAEDIRYNERASAERVNARLKDDHGGRTVRVRGHAKVMAHLMFGVLVLTALQLVRLVT